MAKAKKLPSGSWRVLVYSHSEPVYDAAGKPILDKKGKQKQKRFYESFTSDDPSAAGKREAEYAAAEFALNKKNKANITKKHLGMHLTNILPIALPFSRQPLFGNINVPGKQISKTSWIFGFVI